MTENQKKWLLNLQSKGVKFENISRNGVNWCEGIWEFNSDIEDYRTPAQPIPDIPGWRELCREMRRNGVNVEYENSAGSWIGGHLLTVYGEPLSLPIKSYRIPQQPIPEWREEMTEEKIFSNLRITDAELLEKIDQYMKDNPDSVVPVDEAQIARITELVKDVKIDEETKPDPREEIPHRELQIQWHEDMLHHLMTGEPMREWEYRLKNGDGEWKICYDPHFSEKYEYRRN